MDQIIALLNKPTKKLKKKLVEKKTRYGKNDFVYHLLLLQIRFSKQTGWSKDKTDCYLDIGCGRGLITNQVRAKINAEKTYAADIFTEFKFNLYEEGNDQMNYI